MSVPFRTYRGASGERIQLAEASFGTVPKLHFETEQYPLAVLAAKLGPLRDRFAQVASYSTLYSEVMARSDVQRILAP